MRFQLVLHQRDFVPGTPILTNIADAVTKNQANDHATFQVRSRHFNIQWRI